MCGISGIVRFDQPGSISETALDRMQAALEHRGPDAKGIYIGAFAALAANRLSIIDIPKGNQPMTSRDGRYTIVYNGEIYNFKKLREELKPDWTFQTDSDTEVVLAAYTKWKDKCLGRLNGMFSFFIWDEVLYRGFGARDLLGIKPFAYAYENDAFIFASEAKAIVAARGGRPKVDEAAILEYLVAPLFSGVETSMFQGIEYLQPGHFLTITDKGLTIERWGGYDLTGSLEEDITVVKNEFDRLIRNAVRRTMVADVPVGAYLSGGIDSSIICHLASKEFSGHSKTLTFEYEGQETFDYTKSSMMISHDTPFAERFSTHLGTKEKHFMVIAKREKLMDSIQEIASIDDVIPVWEQQIALHYLARASHNHGLKVILVGDVADETHYGYHFLFREEATKSPAGMISQLSMQLVNKKLISNPLEYFNAKYTDLTQSEGHNWKTDIGRKLATTCLITRRLLPRLLHNGDIHAMAHSVETRVPFADTDLLNFSRKIHPNLALHKDLEKWHIRQAVGWLPDDNRLRKKSTIPIDLNAGVLYRKGVEKVLKENNDIIKKYLDIDAAKKLCQSPKNPTEQERSMLFRIVALDQWSRCYNVRS